MKTVSSSRRPVKRTRSYDASGRRERARQTRARIVDAAAKRFGEAGYAATTIAAVAGDAGTSVDTVYKSFGGKAGLVRAVFDRTLEGVGDTPAEQRSDLLQATETDPRRLIRAWGSFVAELAPLGAPVIALIAAAAATDPELQPLLADVDAQRLKRMTANARRLHDRGYLRSGVSVAHAADVLWTYSSPELYDLLVVRRRMSLDAYAQFVADAMIAALLPPA